MPPYNGAAANRVRLPPGVTQDMINKSLAANPNASTGAYMGPTPMPTTPASGGIVGATSTPVTSGGVTEGSPIPGVDPFALATANDAYTRALASINTRRGGVMSQYGFKASGFDDYGNPQGLEVDPSSMYGGYQQLLDRQAQESMNSDASEAGRGFTGGLANQAEGRLRYTQGGERLNFGSGLLGSLGGLGQELLSAKNARDQAIYQAQLDATRQAADHGNWTPYATTPDNPTTNAGAVQPPVDKPDAKPTTTVTKTPVSRATVLAKTLTAKRVTANKTGATVQRGRGVISIH